MYRNLSAIVHDSIGMDCNVSASCHLLRGKFINHLQVVETNTIPRASLAERMNDCRVIRWYLYTIAATELQ